MTSFRLLGAMLVLSALLATPASAWEATSEPAAAAAQDPTFSIYSNDGPGLSRTLPFSRNLEFSPGMDSRAQLGGRSGLHTSGLHTSGLHMSVWPHRGHHTAAKRHLGGVS
jgi:hypothetical protein